MNTNERSIEERINDLAQEAREISDLAKEVIDAGKQLKAELEREHQSIQKHQKKKITIPGRYAVGKRYDRDYYMFYTGDSADGTPMFTNRPCKAKCYMAYREASAVADFLDESNWDILDMFEALSPKQRLDRALLGETDWDDGNENAIRLHFTNEGE